VADFELIKHANVAEIQDAMTVCVRGLLLTIREKLCNLYISSLEN